MTENYSEEDGRLFDGGLSFFIDHDLQIINSGTLFLHSTIEVGESERVIVFKPFYEIIDDILDNVEDDYSELYSIANELNISAARLKDLAQRIEDSVPNVSDLFDTDYGPPA
jgi:hypothetical protein|tara:strand:+ start:526 stop:861 length:336 start_codon:yes stop_codon:yes gene_type:complete